MASTIKENIDAYLATYGVRDGATLDGARKILHMIAERAIVAGHTDAVLASIAEMRRQEARS